MLRTVAQCIEENIPGLAAPSASSSAFSSSAFSPSAFSPSAFASVASMPATSVMALTFFSSCALALVPVMTAVCRIVVLLTVVSSCVVLQTQFSFLYRHITIYRDMSIIDHEFRIVKCFQKINVV